MKIRKFQMKVCILNSETPVLSSRPASWQLTLCSAREESEGFLSGETDHFHSKASCESQRLSVSHCSRAHHLSFPCSWNCLSALDVVLLNGADDQVLLEGLWYERERLKQKEKLTGANYGNAEQRKTSCASLYFLPHFKVDDSVEISFPVNLYQLVTV